MSKLTAPSATLGTIASSACAAMQPRRLRAFWLQNQEGGHPANAELRRFPNPWAIRSCMEPVKPFAGDMCVPQDFLLGELRVAKQFWLSNGVVESLIFNARAKAKAMSTRPASKAPPARKSAPARKKPANREQAGRKQAGFCRFYLTEPLRGRLDAVLSEIDATQDAREHRDALSALVVEMTNEGLDYYFTGSLVSAKVSFIVQQSSNLGIAGVKQVMAPVIKKVIARLDHEQIVSISASIRTLMA